MRKRAIIFVLLAVIVFSALINVYIPLIKEDMTGLSTATLGNLSANIMSLVSCTWSDYAMNISFGNNLNPGDDDNNATLNYYETGNGTAYSVTVDALSSRPANITIKGYHLISGINDIKVGNISWASNNTIANGSNLLPANSKRILTDYDKNITNYVAINASIGSSVWYRFWLDIPAAQVAGEYTGNYTMQCEVAV